MLHLPSIAYCPQGCYNGGTCTQPGVCTCSVGLTGSDCSTGKQINSLPCFMCINKIRNHLPCCYVNKAFTYYVAM